MIVPATSSIDSAVTPQSSKAFHVDKDVGSLTTVKAPLFYSMPNDPLTE